MQQRLLIEAAGENGLDGAVERAVVGERPGARGFQPGVAIAFGQAQYALRGA